MAATYIADYREELARIGPAAFLQSHVHPVLIVTGLTGTLAGQSGSGTVVAQASDTVLLGKLVGRVFEVAKGKDATPGPVRIGRTADNDICIPEYSISKFHCQLAVVGTDVRIFDCGSTNGTSINGQRLPPKKAFALTGGETLVLGRFALLFHRSRGLVDYLGG